MVREHDLVRAARVRAMLIAHINSLTEPAKAMEIVKALGSQITELGASIGSVVKIIEGLGKSGQVEAMRTEGVFGVRYFRKNGNANHAIVEVTPNIVPKQDETPNGSARNRKFKTLIDTMTIGDARDVYRQLHKLFKDE
jgi:hypothetical protein